MDPADIIAIEPSSEPSDIAVNIVPTELFCMEIQTCVATGERLDVRIVKVVNVLSFSCVCLECGRSFIAISSLKSHMKTHLKNRVTNDKIGEKLSASCNDGEIVVSDDDETIHVPIEDIYARAVPLCDDSDDALTEQSNPAITCSPTSPNRNPDLAQDLCNTEAEHLVYRKIQATHHGRESNLPYKGTRKLFGELSQQYKNSSSHECNVCGKILGGKQKFIDHMNAHTGEKPYMCMVCNRAYRTKSQRNVHSRSHEFCHCACEICGKEFTTASELKVHRIIHKTEKPYPCSTCGKRFRYNHHLTQHMTIHTGLKSLLCSICGKSFSKQSNLNAHRVVHTGEKPHVCTTCGKTFAKRNNLTKHYSVHTGEKSYLCTICGKTFTQLVTLKQHAAIHENISFSCTLCEKSFKYQRSLRQHTSEEHGGKPQTCDVCGKVFKHQRYLRSHLKTHQKPYSCSECNKSFSYKSYFENHMRKHSGETSFRCSHCVSSFTLQRYLTKHINEQH